MQDIQNDNEQFLFETATTFIFLNRRIGGFLRIARDFNISEVRGREIWELAKIGIKENY